MKKTFILALAVAAFMAPSPPLVAASPAPGLETALFAGGCFWSLESAFRKTYGVITATSGYAGGKSLDPSYENYAQNGHVEVVEVSFDPTRISYPALVDAYWHHTDPTDGDGAFVDRGPQYRPIVYYANEAQRKAALASKASLDASKVLGRPVATAILPAPRFWPAEAYHQDYARKNPEAYEFYSSLSGRDEFFFRTWGPATLVDTNLPPLASKGRYVKPSLAALKKSLTPMQFEVTQMDGTEPPFKNTYWDEHREGLYVDIVSGEPLFSSRDKFDSGTGWPSFTQALAPWNVLIRGDNSLGMVRNEVRSRLANSHLGHVFDDGPAPTGLRYCLDSAALRFIPLKDLAASGYGAFLGYFK